MKNKQVLEKQIKMFWTFRKSQGFYFVFFVLFLF